MIDIPLSEEEEGLLLKCVEEIKKMVRTVEGT